MTISVKVLSRYGAWLRSEGAKAARAVLRRSLRNTIVNKVLDGFLLRTVRTGNLATTYIIDPPATLAVLRDPFNSQLSASQFLRVPEMLLYTVGRDYYSPVTRQSALELKTAQMKYGQGNLGILRSADGSLEPDWPASYKVWASPPTESSRGIDRLTFASEQNGTPFIPYGIPDTNEFALIASNRATFGRPSRSPSAMSIYNLDNSPSIWISERCIAEKTGGFRLAPRVSAGAGAGQPASIILPQVPFGQCHYDGRFMFVVVSVTTSSLPAAPKRWRDDAGVGGVLIVRVAFDDAGLPYWDWHHLLRFDQADSPLLQAEQWQRYWLNSRPDEDDAYPAYVAGFTQNSVRSIATAFADDELTCFFVALHGRQHADTPDSIHPMMAQQFTVASLRVTGRASASPAVELRTPLHDVLVESDHPLYAAYGSGDAEVARSWTVHGAHYLNGQPVAVLNSITFARVATHSLQIGMQWVGPNITTFWNYLSAEPVSELLVVDPGKVRLLETASTVGASVLYSWSADRQYSSQNYPLRAGKTTTQIAGDKLLFAAFEYPSGAYAPPIRIVRYDATANTFSIEANLTPGQGGNTAYEQVVPALSCYQQEYRNKEGALVLPYCALVSYWGERDGVTHQFTLQTLDGGKTFETHLPTIGGSHGAYYIGSHTWHPSYGHAFEGPLWPASTP